VQRLITDAWLRSVAPLDTGRLEIWDTRVPGLALRITAGGVASWSVRAMTKDGKRTRATLGTWPAIGIGEARKRALAALAEIQGGGDPVATRRSERAARQAHAGLPTVESRLVEWREAKTKQWSSRYQSEIERLCRVEIVPALGACALIETTRAQWADLIRAKHRVAPGVGSMLYRTVSSFLNHAEALGWIEMPLLPRKGMAAIAPPIDPRERVLSDDELTAVWHAADALRPKGRAFVHLLIMTAAREMEVADIAAGEVARSSGLWTIPGKRTKNHIAITLPLHLLLVDELAAVWPEHGGLAGDGWRLLGAVAGSGLRGFSRLKKKIDTESGVVEWCWHDLRRTARTGMAKLKVSREHAELALNHISDRSELVRRYDRHPYYDEILAALRVWQGYVAGLVGGGAEILPLRARAS